MRYLLAQLHSLSVTVRLRLSEPDCYLQIAEGRLARLPDRK